MLSRFDRIIQDRIMSFWWRCLDSNWWRCSGSCHIVSGHMDKLFGTVPECVDGIVRDCVESYIRHRSVSVYYPVDLKFVAVKLPHVITFLPFPREASHVWRDFHKKWQLHKALKPMIYSDCYIYITFSGIWSFFFNDRRLTQEIFRLIRHKNTVTVWFCNESTLFNEQKYKRIGFCIN